MDQNHEPFSPGAVKRIGYWVTERKFRRLNFETLEKMCRYGCSPEVSIPKVDVRQDGFR